MLKALICATLSGALTIAPISAPRAHDIYTGVHGKDGRLCCGGSDCAITSYREQGGAFEFLTRESRRVNIPSERITFLPVPGYLPSDDSHHAHLCYRRGERRRPRRAVFHQCVRQHLPLLRVHSAGLDLSPAARRRPVTPPRSRDR